MKDVSATPKVAAKPESTDSKKFRQPTHLTNPCRVCGEPGFADALREGPAYCTDHLPEGATLMRIDEDTRELIAAYRRLPPALRSGESLRSRHPRHSDRCHIDRPRKRIGGGTVSKTNRTGKKTKVGKPGPGRYPFVEDRLTETEFSLLFAFLRNAKRVGNTTTRGKRGGSFSP
jgi:hypothetical protein